MLPITAPTVLETVAHVAYLVPVLAAFLRPARRPTPRRGRPRRVHLVPGDVACPCVTAALPSSPWCRSPR